MGSFPQSCFLSDFRAPKKEKQKKAKAEIACCWSGGGKWRCGKIKGLPITTTQHIADSDSISQNTPRRKNPIQLRSYVMSLSLGYGYIYGLQPGACKVSLNTRVLYFTPPGTDSEQKLLKICDISQEMYQKFPFLPPNARFTKLKEISYQFNFNTTALTKVKTYFVAQCQKIDIECNLFHYYAIPCGFYLPNIQKNY
jgi:hypothetical protein